MSRGANPGLAKAVETPRPCPKSGKIDSCRLVDGDQAATDLAAVGSTINAAAAAAATPTTGLLAAGADEVSAAVAAVFGAHAQAYQNVSARAAAFHEQFVQTLAGGAGAYTAAEAAATSPLQALQQEVLSVINAPALALLGRPLIGNGANGAPGTR